MSFPECKVEIKVSKGHPTLVRARGMRINGFEIPNVRYAEAKYHANDARMVIFEVIPTDVIEVDEADW